MWLFITLILWLVYFTGYYFGMKSKQETIMDKWTELRETLQELHEANSDKPDVENVTGFLLNLMDVLDGKRNE